MTLDVGKISAASKHVIKMNEYMFDYYESREEETRHLAETDLVEQAVIKEDEDPLRVCWVNISNDEMRCKILCGFSPDEFLELYDLVESSNKLTKVITFNI